MSCDYHVTDPRHSQASDALTDDSEDVRMNSVRLVWALALLNQDK